MAEADASTAHPPKLGRYEVVGFLASGGMAEVFLGRISGPGGFQRPVALKRILPHLTRSASFRDMFFDEARIVARIRHPNVVAIHELVGEEGELFMVLEYLEGESLAALMRRLAMRGEYLDFALAAHICAEACAGIHAAHELVDEQGNNLKLVHRDISPQNVFITYDGHVKVLDFGVAKAADRMARTQSGVIKGKFEYMSPEQCQGRAVDNRSDIFALGTLLFEISTGRRLFQRPNQLLTMRAICEDPVVSPSAVCRSYPPELESICQRALARDPSARYSSAALMRTALLETIAKAAPPLEDRLASLMRSLFSDRMSEKAEMLAQVRAGVAVTHLPAPETDPELEQDLSLSVFDATKVERYISEPRRTRGWLVIAGALVLASVLVLVSASGLFRNRDENPKSVPSTPQAPIQRPAILEVPSTPGPVTLHLETVPAGAQVTVDGQLKGATPLNIEVPRSSVPLRIELERAGFQPLSQTVVPEVDQRLLLTLVKSAKPARTINKSIKTQPPNVDTGFHRFD